MSNKQQSLIVDFLQDAIDIRQQKGVLYLIPVLLLAALGLGASVGYFFPDEFFSAEKWDVSTTVFSGILAFNAITLALSWAGIGRTLEIISNPGFSSFLQNAGVLRKYSFYVAFIHMMQVIACSVTLTSLILIFIEAVPLWGKRAVFALVIASTLYALRWAAATVTITRDLIVHFASYDGLDAKQKQSLRVVNGNPSTP